MFAKIRRKLNRKTLLWRVLPAFAILAIILSATLVLLPAKNTEAAVGDIGEVRDTLEYDTSHGRYPFVAEVATGVFVSIHQGVDGDGWLQTFTCTALGDIGAAIVDSLEFDTADCTGRPMILKITATTTYILMWASTDQHGQLGTVTIDDAGNIGAALIDSYEYDATRGTEGAVCHLSGTKYALAYSGEGSDGWLATIDIADNGTITKSLADSYEFAPDDTVRYVNIVPVYGTVYSIGYMSSLPDLGSLWVDTITIANDGTITESIIDSLDADTGDCIYFGKLTQRNIIKVDQEGTNGWSTRQFQQDAEDTVQDQGAETQFPDQWRFRPYQGAQAWPYPEDPEGQPGGDPACG